MTTALALTLAPISVQASAPSADAAPDAAPVTPPADAAPPAEGEAPPEDTAAPPAEGEAPPEDAATPPAEEPPAEPPPAEVQPQPVPEPEPEPEPEPQPETPTEVAAPPVEGPPPADQGKIKTQRKAGIGLLTAGGAVTLGGFALTLAFTILGDKEQNAEEPDLSVVEGHDNMARVGGIILGSGLLIVAIGGVVLTNAKKKAAAAETARVRVLPTVGGLALQF